MEYKLEWWHGILVLVVLIILSNYTQTQTTYSDPDKADCDAKLLRDKEEFATYQCLPSSCVEFTAAKQACVADCYSDPTYKEDDIGEWIYDDGGVGRGGWCEIGEPSKCKYRCLHGNACDLAYSCTTNPVCGNGVCESGETENNCPADCDSSCVPNWQCGSWSACSNGGQQSQLCSDGCGDSYTNHKDCGDDDGFEFKTEYLYIGGALLLVLVLASSGKKRKR